MLIDATQAFSRAKAEKREKATIVTFVQIKSFCFLFLPHDSGVFLSFKTLQLDTT
jgi:hypothetical protein